MTDSKWPAWMLRSALLAGGIGALASFFWLTTRSDQLAFLPRHPGAEWIVFPTPANPAIIPAVPTPARFRAEFVVTTLPAAAEVAVAVNRTGVLLCNGQPVADGWLDGSQWKTPRRLALSAGLVAGTNRLELIVTNAFGPPAAWLQLRAAGQGIATDATWEASLAGSDWRPAILARARPRILPGNWLFAPAGEVTGRHGGWLVFAAGLAGLVALAGPGVARRCRRWLEAPRWWLAPGLIVAGLWGALAWNNLPQLGRLYGFDVEGHEEYIRYVQQRHALPLATDGWQMYQPPLYYWLSAQCLDVLGYSVDDAAAVTVLRAISLVIGLVHCAFIFLGLRELFPAERWPAVVGTLFAAFLPAHLVVSHYITNENLCALWVTVSFYCFLRTTKNRAAPLWLWPAGGAALGFALLTKFSAVLVLPVALAAMLWRGLTGREPSGRGWLRSAGLWLLALGLVCGWHYARVWKAFGTPLVGNWDAASGFAWWQFPGYRTLDYYTGFGAALTHPLFSSVQSFADGLFSTFWSDGLASGSATMAFIPPWNYGGLHLAALLGLAGTAVLVAGGGISGVRLWRSPRADAVLLLGFVLLLGLGLLYMTLRVASYAQVKSFYALAALLPVCVLFVTGAEWFARRGGWLARAALGLFAAWLGLSYAGLWVRPGNPQTHVARGNLHADRGEFGPALAAFQQALAIAPAHPIATARQVECLVKLGRAAEAAAVATQTVPALPEEAALRLHWAAALLAGGDTNRALAEWQTAVRLGPQDVRAAQQLALFAWQTGDPRGAIATARAALTRAPYEPTLHALLGVNLVAADQLTDARWHLDYAVQLKPDFALARFQLGRVWLLTGDATAAVPHLEFAVTANPRDLEARRQYALALQQAGQGAAAVGAWRGALQLAPDQPDFLNNLAWLLATDADAGVRRPAEAVQLAGRACDLTGRQQPALLGTLAAAYAAAGDFPRAVQTADAAIALAERLQFSDLAQRNRELRELYRAGRPAGLPAAQ